MSLHFGEFNNVAIENNHAQTLWKRCKHVSMFSCPCFCHHCWVRKPMCLSCFYHRSWVRKPMCLSCFYHRSWFSKSLCLLCFFIVQEKHNSTELDALRNKLQGQLEDLRQQHSLQVCYHNLICVQFLLIFLDSFTCFISVFHLQWYNRNLI